MKLTLRFLPLLAMTFVAASPIHAATIANWKVLVAAPGGTPVTGATTDSPVFGGATNQVDGAQLAGRFGTVGTPQSAILAVGETLTVSASITLTGGLTSNGHYRFGVFNDGGRFDIPSEGSWTGGWVHSIGLGLYQGSTGTSFVSTLNDVNNNAVPLTPSSSTTTGSLDGDSLATYLWTMTITRDSASTVDLFTSFVGGDGTYNNSYTVNNQTTSLFTYTAAGILSSGVTDLDQLTISNAQFSVVPEPAASLLGGLSALLFLRRRR